MARGNYGFESFYEGAPSSLDPGYGNFIGFKMNASGLGFPGSPQTGNQLGEAVNALKQGVKAFEVSMLGVQDADQAIPSQHFTEMKALMRLSGVKPSVHGPLIDAAGFNEKGWSGEFGREDNERKMFSAIERAKALDQNGNLPIVFHAANGAPGSEFSVNDGVKPGEEGRFRVQKGFAINKETGQMVPLEREFKYRPGHPELLARDKDGKWGEGRLYTPEAQLESANVTEWENKLTDLATFTKHTDDVLGSAEFVLDGYQNAVIKDGVPMDIKTGKELPKFTQGQAAHYNKLRDADIFLENVQLNLNSAFHKAFKYSNDDKQREKLEEFAKNYSVEIAKVSERVEFPDGKTGEIPKVFTPIEKKKVLVDAIHKLNNITKEYGAPRIFEEVEDFAKDQAATTFSNLAIKSYDKWKDKSPVLAIENLYQGMAFSKADDLKELVDKSRDNFVDYLVNEKKVDKKKAEKLATEKIGVTWDVGHLNMSKKKGFTDEDILEETKKLTGGKKDKGKYIKHVHLTDNFGFGDSHLAPGMGNVPFRDILEELEKTGRFDEMNKIVEAGGFVQHFKKSPHPWALGAFGSPLYSMKQGPQWNQAMEVQGSYFGGYGTLNPQTHHSYFGAGFTTMPVELGGQMPGGNSRFDGRPMA